MNARNKLFFLFFGLLLSLTSCFTYKGGNFYQYQGDYSSAYGSIMHTVWFAPRTPLLTGIAPDTVLFQSKDSADYRVAVGAIYLSDTEVSNQNYVHFLNQLMAEDASKETEIPRYISLEGAGCQIRKSGDSFTVNEGYDGYPVVQVSKLGAEAYCQWLTKGHKEYRDSLGLTEMPPHRLPSYLEMMLAQQTGKVWVKEKNGKKEKAYTTLDRAWLKKNSGGKVHEFARKKPDFNDLYDVEGNVREWVSDRYIEGDNAAWEKAIEKTSNVVIYAGSDFSSDVAATKKLEYSYAAEDATFSNVGFRVCIPIPGRVYAEF